MNESLAALICRECLAVSPGDRFLLVGPIEMEGFYRELTPAIKAAGATVLIYLWEPGSGRRVPLSWFSGSLRLDGSVVYVTKVIIELSGGLTEHEHRRLRSWQAAGLRHLLLEYPSGLQGSDATSCLEALNIDYGAMRRLNERLAKHLSGGSTLEITDPLGTSLRASIQNRPILREDCRFGEGEPVFQLPGGEVYVAPVEESVQGILCIDLALHGFPDGGKAVVSLVDGCLVDLAVPDRPDLAAAVARSLGVGQERLGEIGFGTNPGATVAGRYSLGEKALGTAHVGIGDNTHMGGLNSSPRHVDICLAAPTVRLDGEILLQGGRLVLPEG